MLNNKKALLYCKAFLLLYLRSKYSTFAFRLFTILRACFVFDNQHINIKTAAFATQMRNTQNNAKSSPLKIVVSNNIEINVYLTFHHTLIVSVLTVLPFEEHT